MTRYLGGMIGGKLNRKSELNPADWTNSNIAKDYSHIITVPTSSTAGYAVGQEADGFAQEGQTVAISGDGLTAVVGIPLAEQNSSISNVGQVQIYEWDAVNEAWGPATQGLANVGIYASDRQAVDYFGYSVAIDSDGSTIAVGAMYEDAGGSNAGKVYIFEKGAGWDFGSNNEVAMIRTSTDTTNTYVGSSLALSGDGQTLLVGGYGKTSSRGEAFIFEKPGGGWVTGVGAAAGEEAILTASDGDNYDYFGWTVALSNDGSTAVVGAYDADGAGNAYSNQGQAYVFERPGAFGTWTTTTEDAILTASTQTDGSTSDRFSQYALSVSGDGSTIVIGSANEDGVNNELPNNSGAVFLYEKGVGWTTKTEDVVFRPDNLTGSHKFGISASISADGNTVVVGASQSIYNNTLSNFVGQHAGSIYIFEKGAGWVDAPTNQVTQLHSPIVDAPKSNFRMDEFGTSIWVNPDASRIIVGGEDIAVVFHKPTVATYNKVSTENNEKRVIPNTGILDLNTAGVQDTDTKVPGYGKTQKLTMSDGASSDNVGVNQQSLAISRDGLTLIVGVAGHDTGGFGSAGAAYVFEYTNNSWTEVAKLTSSIGPTANDYFGQAVAISDDGSTIAIGAEGEDVLTSTGGAVFVFERPGAFGTWTTTTEDAYLHAISSSAGKTGCSVAMSGDGTVIFGGAEDEHHSSTTDAGAVYVWEKGAGWSNGSSNLTAKLVNDVLAQDEYFGAIVRCSQDGTTLAIGAARTDGAKGQVCIFEKGAGWVDGSSNLSAKLTASDGQAVDYLVGTYAGTAALSIDDAGNTVVAGARNAHTNYDQTGKVYIWEKNVSWTDATEDAIIYDAGALGTRATYGESFGFGTCVQISGNGEKLVVGAYSGRVIIDENKYTDGCVHIFEKGTGWGNRLANYVESFGDNDSPMAGESFGRTVICSNDGNIVITAAQGDDTIAVDAGAVFVYNYDSKGKTENRVLSRSGFGRIIGNNKFNMTWDGSSTSTDWANTQLFTEYDVSPASTSENNDIYFGGNTALSYNGKRYVVSAQYQSSGDQSIYIYDFLNGMWHFHTKIKPTTNNTNFGMCVDISDDGNTIVTSAYADRIVYVYEYSSANDKWEKSAELTATATVSNFARTVRISGDGNTVVAGSESAESTLPPGGALSNVGGLWVWEKPTSGWTNATQDAILYKATRTAVDYLGNASQAWTSAVAISKDGSIISAAIEGLDTDQGSGTITNAGGILVFKRPGGRGTWTDGTESAQLEKDYLGSTSGNTIGQYGMDMSGDGNHIIATDFDNDRIYIWEKSAASDWSDALSNTYINHVDPLYSQHISDDGKIIIGTGNAQKYVNNFHSWNYIEVYEKGAGWNNDNSNKVRTLIPWRNENANIWEPSSAISGDGSVYAFGAYAYDRFLSNCGQSYVFDAKKYEDKPVMNKTGMFSLKDMYQSKLTES